MARIPVRVHRSAFDDGGQLEEALSDGFDIRVPSQIAEHGWVWVLAAAGIDVDVPTEAVARREST